VNDIRRQTRRQYSAEEKIRIVLEGLRGEESCVDSPGRHALRSIAGMTDIVTAALRR
jgi:transposase-like protein